LQPKSRQATSGKADKPANQAKDLLKSASGIVAGGLSVDPVRNSKLVVINFDSPSAQFSARAANALADGFIAAGLSAALARRHMPRPIWKTSSS